MIFWLVLKLEINYNRVMISRRIFVSFRGFFEDYIFCMVKYLNFHNSTFALRYFVMFLKRPPNWFFSGPTKQHFTKFSGGNGSHCSAVHSWIKEPCFGNKCKTMSCIRPEIHLQ